MMSENIARLGLPSQDGPGLAMPQRTRNQFTTLNDGSRIHIHAMVDSTVGTMNGSSMTARIVFLKRKSWFITSARASPPAIFSAVAANV
jgi:hypothetical protein